MDGLEAMGSAAPGLAIGLRKYRIRKNNTYSELVASVEIAAVLASNNFSFDEFCSTSSSDSRPLSSRTRWQLLKGRMSTTRC